MRGPGAPCSGPPSHTARGTARLRLSRVVKRRSESAGAMARAAASHSGITQMMRFVEMGTTAADSAVVFPEWWKLPVGCSPWGPSDCPVGSEKIQR